MLRQARRVSLYWVGFDRDRSLVLFFCETNFFQKGGTAKSSSTSFFTKIKLLTPTACFSTAVRNNMYGKIFLVYSYAATATSFYFSLDSS
jgi:hypothetical protein